MRKIILVALLILLAVICVIVVGTGIKIGPFKVYSYSEIEKASSERKVLLSELNEKNGNEFRATQKMLLSSTGKYQEKKEEYDSLVENGELTTESNIYNSSLYDVDFLLTVVGNYATQNGVTLQFDVFKSSSSSISSEYVICDLNFTVTGDYIPITNYIFNILLFNYKNIYDKSCLNCLNKKILMKLKFLMVIKYKNFKNILFKNTL